MVPTNTTGTANINPANLPHGWQVAVAERRLKKLNENTTGVYGRRSDAWGSPSDEQIACAHDEVGLPRAYRDAMNCLANQACLHKTVQNPVMIDMQHESQCLSESRWQYLHLVSCRLRRVFDDRRGARHIHAVPFVNFDRDQALV